MIMVLTLNKIKQQIIIYWLRCSMIRGIMKAEVLCYPSDVHVLHRSLNVVISHCCTAEDGIKM